MNIFSLLIVLLMPFFLHAQTPYVVSAIEDSQSSEVVSVVMKSAYKKLGIEIDIVELHAKTAIEKSNSGVVDAELFRIDNIDKKYTNLIKVPVAVNYDLVVAVTAREDVVIDGWESLRPYYIGIKRGVLFSDRGTQNMTRIELNDLNQLYKMVAKKRIDILITSQENALKYLYENPSVNLNILTPEIQTIHLYHYLHKDNAHLLAPLTEVLLEMQKNGEIEKIRKTYFDGFYLNFDKSES